MMKNLILSLFFFGTIVASNGQQCQKRQSWVECFDDQMDYQGYVGSEVLREFVLSNPSFAQLTDVLALDPSKFLGQRLEETIKSEIDWIIENGTNKQLRRGKIHRQLLRLLTWMQLIDSAALGLGPDNIVTTTEMPYTTTV
eukprot:Platyproteum_vivax@DN2370_c0_g1_i1.p1